MAKSYHRINEWFFTGVPDRDGGRREDFKVIAGVLKEFGRIPSYCLSATDLLDAAGVPEESKKRIESGMDRFSYRFSALDSSLALVAHVTDSDLMDGAAIDYALRSGKDCLVLDNHQAGSSLISGWTKTLCPPKNLVFKRYDSRQELENIVRSFAQGVVANHPSLPGAYVVLEGGEGCGKTTQMKMLGEDLTEMGIGVVCTHEPGGSVYADLIRKVLLAPSISSERLYPKAELLLLEAARTQLCSSVVIPAMEEGKLVLTDRNYLSTYAYQGFGRGLSWETIDLLNTFAMGGLKPDLTIIIDVDPVEGLARATTTEFGKKDRFESENLEFHLKVRQGYLALAKREPNTYITPFIAGDPNLMRKNIREIVDKHLLSNFKEA